MDIKASVDVNAPASLWIEAAQKAMRIEAAAVARASQRLDGNLSCAVEMILAHSGQNGGHWPGQVGPGSAQDRRHAVQHRNPGRIPARRRSFARRSGPVLAGRPHLDGFKKRQHLRAVAADSVPARIAVAAHRHPGQSLRAAGVRKWTWCWMHRWSARPIRTIWRPPPAPPWLCRSAMPWPWR